MFWYILMFEMTFNLNFVTIVQFKCNNYWNYFNADSCLHHLTIITRNIFWLLIEMLLYEINTYCFIYIWCSDSLVVWRLWASELPGEHCPVSRLTVTRSKRKVVKMVTVVVVVFVICWTPLQSLILYSNFSQSDNEVGTFYI